MLTYENQYLRAMSVVSHSQNQVSNWKVTWRNPIIHLIAFQCFVLGLGYVQFGTNHNIYQTSYFKGIWNTFRIFFLFNYRMNLLDTLLEIKRRTDDFNFFKVELSKKFLDILFKSYCIKMIRMLWICSVCPKSFITKD